MATKLGRRLAALDPTKVDNPILAKLIRELHGAVCRTGGFNDSGRVHSDYVDNDSHSHSDLTKASFCYSDSTPHTDLSYRDGREYNHSDGTDMCDNHSDSDPNHLWRWSYSDITR